MLSEAFVTLSPSVADTGTIYTFSIFHFAALAESCDEGGGHSYRNALEAKTADL